MNKPLILVVEDDNSVKNLITTTLKAHDYRYLTAPNGSTAILEASSHNPDIVLLDLGLPDIDGVDVIKKIRTWSNMPIIVISARSTAILEASSHNPDIVLLDLGLPDIDGVDVIKKIRTWSNMPIIVISARSEDTDKIDALDAGADDYLTKPFSVEELLARLRVTQRRLNMIQNEAAAEAAVFTNGQLRIDYAAGCAYLGDDELHLTPIEYKLLCLLSRNIGKVLTHTFITQNIWGSSWDNDIASLRVFMATLRAFKKYRQGFNPYLYYPEHLGQQLG